MAGHNRFEFSSATPAGYCHHEKSNRGDIHDRGSLRRLAIAIESDLG